MRCSQRLGLGMLQLAKQHVPAWCQVLGRAPAMADFRMASSRVGAEGGIALARGLSAGAPGGPAALLPGRARWRAPALSLGCLSASGAWASAWLLNAPIFTHGVLGDDMQLCCQQRPYHVLMTKKPACLPAGNCPVMGCAVC